jgi:hypothetical protein
MLMCAQERIVSQPGQASSRRLRRSRLDIVLTADRARIAAIEVKVLSELAPRQLERYHEAMPDANFYALVYPERLTFSSAEMFRRSGQEAI